MSLFDSSGDGAGVGAGWTRIVAAQDPKLELRAVIVLHSLARGPGFGGVRRVAYASEAAGLADAKRLAEAMSLKCAMARLPAGGAKTVIFDNPRLREDPQLRAAAYEAVGRVIERLGGDYVCGPDVGTGVAELDALRRGTRWVNLPTNDASRSTAQGVLAGLRGLSRVVFGDERLESRTYVIQGLGGVGSALARALVAAGASVAGYDPSASARARAAELGVELLEAEALLRTPCDVFMPCALGHTLTVEVCERGPWRAVCGAANNQLAEVAAAEVLRRRGIAWAPDFVVNAGAVLEGRRDHRRRRGGGARAGRAGDRGDRRSLRQLARAGSRRGSADRRAGAGAGPGGARSPVMDTCA